ncbi:MAG: SoxR reducing system RseC family protein, partial [Butyrivibrio sp.]|nr:SoxR reducing system RseC family protein [Butyrivibrio sp.]
MTQSAIVEGLTANGDAMVRVYQKSACAHDCSECAGICGAKKTITVQARNPLRARPGDLVTVETLTQRIIQAAALVYLLPLAVLL